MRVHRTSGMPWVVAVLAVVAAGGCTAPTAETPAPVVERSRPVGDPAPASYVVRARDSLYAIAWRFGLDYVAVARWNGIGPPYIIHPGQTLVLRPGGAAAVDAGGPAREAPTPARPARVSPNDARTTAPRRTETPTTPVVRAPNVPETAAPQSSPQGDVPKARPAPKPTQAAPAQTAARGPGARWRWPVDVRPERGFGGDNKGVDYSVPAGRPVVVAAPGQVVYAGPGLAGFRHLVIVEHGGGYLSAYSLNADPSVGEGADLAGGAQLAAIGGSGTVDRKLHFEVRRNGSPIDPGRVIGR